MQENNLKQIVENILNREWIESEKVKSNYFEEYKSVDKNTSYDDYKKDKDIIYLKKDIPELINQGDTQAILQLDKEYVAKFPIIKFSGHNMLHYYPNAITDSVKIWPELGFVVPEHRFYYVNVADKIYTTEEKHKRFDSPRAGLTVNLAQDDKKIVTYSEDAIKGLSNHAHLKEEFEYGVALIKNIENNPKDYALMPHGHIDEYGSIDKAIRHMFLVQIDSKTNDGKLILGDIDHLFIYKLD
jgi:hypothetical protein